MHDPQGLSPRERAPLDQLLARLLLREPDAELYALLARPECAALGLEPSDLRPESLEASREEFARLFLLPGGAPPYASAWLEGERERLGAQLCGLVTRVLRALGREPVESGGGGNLPLDHVGLILDTAAYAALSKDPADADLGEHLVAEALTPWVPSFAQALQRQARLPLYRAAGELLGALYAAAPAEA